MSTETILALGRNAMQRIDAAEAAYARAVTREDWRQVGEALREGRRLHGANKDFKAWCASEGYRLKASVRSNAMWMAEHWASCDGLKTDAVHPDRVRQAFRAENKPFRPALTPEQEQTRQAGREAWARIQAREAESRRNFAAVAECLSHVLRQFGDWKSFHQWCDETEFRDLPRTQREGLVIEHEYAEELDDAGLADTVPGGRGQALRDLMVTLSRDLSL